MPVAPPHAGLPHVGGAGLVSLVAVCLIAVAADFVCLIPVCLIANGALDRRREPSLHAKGAQRVRVSSSRCLEEFLWSLLPLRAVHGCNSPKEWFTSATCRRGEPFGDFPGPSEKAEHVHPGKNE
jgi:hypothetical protein